MRHTKRARNVRAVEQVLGRLGVRVSRTLDLQYSSCDQDEAVAHAAHELKL